MESHAGGAALPRLGLMAVAGLALVKGRRQAHTQLCYSNLASVPEYAASVVNYAKAAWDPAGDLAQIETDYYDSLYGPASPAMREHARACRALFDLKTAQGPAGEDVLFGFNFGRYAPEKDAETRRQVNAAMAHVRGALKLARSTSPRPYVAAKIAKLESAADYVEGVFMSTYGTRGRAPKAMDLTLPKSVLVWVAVDPALAPEWLTAAGFTSTKETVGVSTAAGVKSLDVYRREVTSAATLSLQPVLPKGAKPKDMPLWMAY